MNKFIFDVDGTLTPSRQGMNGRFQDYFLDFCYGNYVYLVTGSDRAKTLEQVGPDVLDAVKRCYNCNGNDVWEQDVNVRTNEWTLPEAAQDWLSEQLTASEFPLRTGLHFEHRPGMVNFSVVGRNADKIERAKYVTFDSEHNERKLIAFWFNARFLDLEAKVGGETGIDISPKGFDKSQIIKDFDPEDVLYFFGDAMHPGGNDEPLMKKVHHHRHVRDWRNTWEFLTWFQEQGIAA